jgi:hypothetical protein
MQHWKLSLKERVRLQLQEQEQQHADAAVTPHSQMQRALEMFGVWRKRSEEV